MRKDLLACSDPALFDDLARICAVGYLSLLATDGFPRAIAEVGIFRVEAISWTGKVQVGQHYAAERQTRLRAQLVERGDALDRVTLREMAAYSAG